MESPEFLKEPHPDWTTKFVAGAEGTSLKVGIKIITHTVDGLKIRPTPSVVFEILPQGTDYQMDMRPDAARKLAARIIEFCDFIEQGATADG